jgi:hypothetical protein
MTWRHHPAGPDGIGQCGERRVLAEDELRGRPELLDLLEDT